MAAEIIVIIGGMVHVFLPILFVKLMIDSGMKSRASVYATALGSISLTTVIYASSIVSAILIEENSPRGSTFIITFITLAFLIVGLVFGLSMSTFTRHLTRWRAFFAGSTVPSVMWGVSILIVAMTDV